MKKLLILSSLSIILLSSCSSNVKGSWSCPILEGGKGSCVSIGEADSSKSADNNINLPESYFDKNQKIEITLLAPRLKDLEKISAKSKAQPIENDIQDDVQHLTKNSNINHSPKNNLRTEEKVGKVWFAPYIDSDGNQHSESTIFVVDEKPKWISQR